jgi:hypothetical protein
MKVYKVLTGHGDHQNHIFDSLIFCVVCETMGEAEELFAKKYPYTTIQSIELWSDYVIVKGKDTP